MRETKTTQPDPRRLKRLALQIALEVVAELLDRARGPSPRPRESPARRRRSRKLGRVPAVRSDVGLARWRGSVRSNGSVKRRPAWSPHVQLTVAKILAGIAQVEHHLGAQRIVDGDIDQRASLRRYCAGAPGCCRERSGSRPSRSAGGAARRGRRDRRRRGSCLGELRSAGCVAASTASSGKLRRMTSSSSASRCFGRAVDAAFRGRIRGRCGRP